MSSITPMKRYAAECIGTFWLVFGGCGSAVLAAAFTTDVVKISSSPDTLFPLGIGLVGVSLAFGLTVMTMAYAIGHISGCHLNPAVSFGLFAGKRFSSRDLLPYIIAQLVGAVIACVVLYLIASGKTGFEIGAFAANGYGEYSPGKYSMVSAFLAEFVLTFIFLIVIMGATDARAPKGFAPVPIGFCLTLIHLIGIPVTNLSVNPARSTGPALILAVFGGKAWAIAQLWLFWLAPILGAVAAGYLYSSFFEDKHD
ncbi:MAG: aquaporin Z [Microcoleus sp.]